MVTICTASLTFNNSTFCPHSVFVCFVWIWEQTAIISLYNINWLVCIIQLYSIVQSKPVHCAVRTDWFSSTKCRTKTHNSYLKFTTVKHRIVQLVSSLPLLFSDAASCSSSHHNICIPSSHWQWGDKPACSEQLFPPFFHHKQPKVFHGIQPILL